MGVLVLLDLSAAFDTVDHSILLNTLLGDLGITGTAHLWMASYLKERLQRVVINDTQSEPFQLDCGVPQGYVLGPIPSLSRIVEKHNTL